MHTSSTGISHSCRVAGGFPGHSLLTHFLLSCTISPMFVGMTYWTMHIS